MKLYTLLLLIAFIIPIPGKGQNLVPNPGFELYNNCPTNLSDINYSPGYSSFPFLQSWTSPLQATTPDYYNVCAAGTSAGVPDGGFGHKPAHTGNGYAGIISWEGNYNNGVLIQDYREYIQTRLTQPMLAGQQYCVSFYISSAIANNSSAYNYVSVDRLGINFSNNQFTNAAGSNISLPYGISGSLAQIEDTAKWLKISGTYTAAGGEQWLILGYFNDTPVYRPVYPASIDSSRNLLQYIYIDDISVSSLSQIDTNYISHDTVLCDQYPIDIYLHDNEDASLFLWNTNDTTATIHIRDTGTYWCISNINCNYAIDTYHVYKRPAPILQISDTLVNCNEQPVTAYAGDGYLSYLWNTGATTDSLVITQSGVYYVTVTDQCGIQADTVQAYIQSPTPAPVAHDTIVCQFAINPLIRVDGTNITWYGALTDHYGLPIQPVIATGDTGSYVMYVSQTIGGCTSLKIPVGVSVTSAPQSTHAAISETICDRDTLTLGGMLPNVSYSWNTGVENCCITVSRQGTYIRTAYNSCGAAMDTTIVTMLPCNKCVMLPNAFTPNGDGFNEVFKPVIRCPIKNYHLAIYNRWGTRVYETGNPEDGWTGLENAAPATLSSYIYILEYTSMGGEHYRLRGNVSVIH